MTATPRMEAILAAKTPAIKRAIARMTDKEFADHRAKLNAARESGAVAASVTRMIKDIK